jgi:hypothetical protein
MEEFNYQETPQKQEGPNTQARIVNIVNACALVLMLLLCLTKEGGFFAFFVGLGMGVYNLISMIVFIVQKNVFAFVSNIIWMLLMPIIGFGCCAMSYNLAWH